MPLQNQLICKSTLKFDWTQSQLPKGICIISSQIHGWGVATTREFAREEVILRLKSRFVPWHTHISVRTDLGTKELSMRVHSAFDKLTLEAFSGLPTSLLESIATHFGMSQNDLEGLWKAATNDGKNLGVLSDQGVPFINHADDPNTGFEFEGWVPGVTLTGYSSLFAVRDICAGEEVTCNYNAYEPEFKHEGKTAEQVC